MKRRAALRVLDRLARDRTSCRCPPRAAREQLFRAAAQHGDRERVLAQVATELGLTAEQLLEGLFADLPEERLLVSTPPGLDTLQLAHCDAYTLEADCVLGDGRDVGRLQLKSNDPIHPARTLSPFDSRVEERFARDFGKLAMEWDLVREPAPIAVGAHMCFPDFLLRHRTTREQFWLEIVGFWTPDYLRHKLTQLKAAGLSRLILCVDDLRRCAPSELESLGRVVRFRRYIDAGAVLAIVEGTRD